MVVETTADTALDRGQSWLVDERRGVVVRHPASLMGILNVTPDSFSDGGRFAASDAAIAAGVAMVRDGATWLDVGGESSRPGAVSVSADDEMARVVPVIAGLRAAGVTAPISIDTVKATVARAALDAGATAINDISAGGDPAMFALAAERGCPLVLMHMQGDPATMQRAPSYGNVVEDVVAHLASRIASAIAAGVAESALLIDPGIGFGKTMAHNLALLAALPRFAALGRPLVLGVSRKSFIGKLLGTDLTPTGRDHASHVLHAMLAPHCALLRVHDVTGARQALLLATAVAGTEVGHVR